ncbi:hypothetical protein J3R82DRAFT_3304 [Butyriboletus roseoflavus]|nr:hypothetical protein J3R82DRAFT_3304 [Butyriboletus roseoflavus]
MVFRLRVCELTTEQVFIVSFDIPLWQRRMKAIGQVSIEFIASGEHVYSIGVSLLNCTPTTGRMWSITFFSTDPSSSATTSKKSRMATYTWHVMVNLLESSIPTYFDSQLVVDAAPPLVPESIQAPKVWDPRSMTFPPVCDQQSQSRSPMYAYNSDGKAHSRLSRGHNIPPEQDKHPTPSSSTHPPPTDPQWGLPSSLLPSTETPPPVSIHLGCGDRKLGRRNGPGDSSSTHLNIIDSIEPYTEPSETPTTKPNNWSEHGVGYTNAVVSSLGDGLASHLMHDRSRYLFPDGTLRGRLEATLVKSASSKDCIIC